MTTVVIVLIIFGILFSIAGHVIDEPNVNGTSKESKIYWAIGAILIFCGFAVLFLNLPSSL